MPPLPKHHLHKKKRWNNNVYIVYVVVPRSKKQTIKSYSVGLSGKQNASMHTADKKKQNQLRARQLGVTSQDCFLILRIMKTNKDKIPSSYRVRIFKIEVGVGNVQIYAKCKPKSGSAEYIIRKMEGEKHFLIQHLKRCGSIQSMLPQVTQGHKLCMIRFFSSYCPCRKVSRLSPGMTGRVL